VRGEHKITSSMETRKERNKPRSAILRLRGVRGGPPKSQRGGRKRCKAVEHKGKKSPPRKAVVVKGGGEREGGQAGEMGQGGRVTVTKKKK